MTGSEDPDQTAFQEQSDVSLESLLWFCFILDMLHYTFTLDFLYMIL